MSAVSLPAPLPPALVQLGRPLLGTTLDLLLIAGGLSVLVVAALVAGQSASAAIVTLGPLFPVVTLACNSAHFGSSTVRLYTKPRAFQEFPFLTLVVPVLAMLVTLAAVAFGHTLGRHVYSLYLTWSPYHYAAQAYGIAAMYCFRSGCVLDPRARLLLRASCLMPFLHAFFGSPGLGIEWFVPLGVLQDPTVVAARRLLILILTSASFALPAMTFVAIALRRRGAVPLMAMIVVLSNALWWVTLSYMNAFVIATIFHSVQYLVLVAVFHVRDHLALPGNQRGASWLAVTFYVQSLALGYLLFNVCCHAFVAAGFGLVESTLLVAAVVNIHHFVVDGFIWRFGRSKEVRAAAAA